MERITVQPWYQKEAPFILVGSLLLNIDTGAKWKYTKLKFYFLTIPTESVFKIRTAMDTKIFPLWRNKNILKLVMEKYICFEIPV